MVTQVDGHALFEQHAVGYPEPAELAPRSILEIGPGPGVGTFEPIGAWPTAHITCLEPGDVPRGALLDDQGRWWHLTIADAESALTSRHGV